LSPKSAKKGREKDEFLIEKYLILLKIVIGYWSFVIRVVDGGRGFYNVLITTETRETQRGWAGSGGQRAKSEERR